MILEYSLEAEKLLSFGVFSQMFEFYERVSGARMHAAYIRPGGVHQVGEFKDFTCVVYNMYFQKTINFAAMTINVNICYINTCFCDQ